MLDPLKNDQNYILRISNGDEKAFSELFECYKDRIYTFVLKVTRSPLLSEEIVEDVFLKIWLYRGRLVNVENFQSYIYKIARNETYKKLKQIAINYNTVLFTEQHEQLTNQSCEDILIVKEFNSILQQAIDRLPNRQKNVYKLVKVGAMSRTEVAKILELKPETVKFHLAEAMKRIRTFCMIHLHSIFIFAITFGDYFENISK